MTFNTILHYTAGCFCVGEAFFALLRDHRSFVHRIFAFGMLALALESFFNGLCAQAIFPEQAIRWQQWRLIAAATLPGTWLIFSLSFGRKDYRALLSNWKWVVLATFLLCLVFVSLLRADFFRGAPIYLPHGWEFGLGWSGYGFYICFLFSFVLIMMILEKTLRESKGRKRWQVKFLLLGIGGYFAARIYTGSHTLIFQAVNLELDVINAAVLLVANLLIVISILRNGVMQTDIYFSQDMLYNSFTVMVVGVYFLALGLSSKILTHFLSFPLRAIFVFLALLGLLIVLLSDRLRLKMKHFISRHLRRPQYDYRNVWMVFAARTAALVEEKALCEAVVKMISEMFDILSVSLWLIDERREGVKVGGSTVFSEAQIKDLLRLRKGAAELIRLMREQEAIVDLEDGGAVGTEELKQFNPSFFQQARIRHCIPLKQNGDLLGLITLDDRVSGAPFSFEELDMLRTIADQVAAKLLNLKLSEQLLKTKEMEAFQIIAAFFVHDLKNVASKLSLLLQNMHAHFENPAFREDALRSVSRSVEKINSMCCRLSLVREQLEIRPVEADLEEVVTSTLTGLNGLIKTSIVEELHPVPRVFLDPVQISKVLTNLVLNAHEAIGDEGEILVITGSQDGWVELTVSDNGCGISKEFMDQFLFQPFRTTKTRGTGIGLFQSKMIVDAHKGQIEVESREGEGSIFRVLLPVRGPEFEVI